MNEHPSLTLPFKVTANKEILQTPDPSSDVIVLLTEIKEMIVRNHKEEQETNEIKLEVLKKLKARL